MKELKISPQELNERLKWPTDVKIKHAIEKFIEFYITYDGWVYLSFSGGKDSQTLAWIIDEIFKGRWKEYVRACLISICTELGKDWKKVYTYERIFEQKLFGIIPKVFCDTGLEFPEIRKHVKTFEGVVWMKPKMKFPDVIKNIGVAVGSKKIAMQIRRLRGYIDNPSSKNEATRTLYLTGIKRDGTKSNNFGLSKFWKRLLDAPFKTSDKCCDIFKKEPFRRYEEQNGRKPITATTTEESLQRRGAYLMTGCNSFEKGKEMSRPFSIFTDQDVWNIANEFGLKFCEVYYDREYEIPDGKGGFFKIILEGLKRTGCMFCLFGIHLEPKNKLNRFQRLYITHPKQYAFMVNTCGLGKVLSFIGIDYGISESQFISHLKQYSLPL